MQFAYGGLFLLSLALIPLYFIFLQKKQSQPWLLILFICISIVNLGYTLIAISPTVEMALVANKIAYFGQAFVPLCMFNMILRLCGYRMRGWLLGILIFMAVLMFGVVMTTGHLDWYYTSASIEKVAGATVLKKTYGFLHFTNLIYVVAYYVIMLTSLILSFIRHKGASQKHAIIMLTIVLGNIVMWCVGKVIRWDFELLSVTYVMSAGAFLGVWLMLQDYVHKRDISKFTAAEQKRLAVGITALSMEEKLTKVLLVVKEAESLGIREREILELILNNKRRKDIANDLHLSENTVKTYTRSLYSKLGVSCREELYSLLLKN